MNVTLNYLANCNTKIKKSKSYLGLSSDGLNLQKLTLYKQQTKNINQKDII